jgi:acetyltransferase-like isoleucine patch superfamily enzyme
MKAYQVNHPLDRLSTHGFFLNSELGYVRETHLPLSSLVIEHDDAWLGDSVIITPNSRRIGLGAFVGTGSIVTEDVADFAVFAGIRMRLINGALIQRCRKLFGIVSGGSFRSVNAHVTSSL